MERRFIQTGSRWEELAGYSRDVVDGDWILVSGTVGPGLCYWCLSRGTAIA
jgi:hypothetical protein